MPQLFPILFKMIFLLIVSMTMVLLLKLHFQAQENNINIKEEGEFKGKNIEYKW